MKQTNTVYAQYHSKQRVNVSKTVPEITLLKYPVSATSLQISYLLIVFIKLDFPTPDPPVIPIFISTFFQPSSFVLINSSLSETPCSSMWPSWTSS